MIFQESGITFNNVKKIGTKISSFPLGNPDNYLYNGDSASRKDTEHIDYKGGIINAIDIDWNGVNTESIPEEYVLVLNTTSDVLKWIKKLEYRISILENNGSRPDNPEYYIINWDGNGATTSASPNQTSVLSGNSVILPTTNPKREYTITWNANGGSGTIGGTTKVTYTFNNWWTARVGGDQITSNTKPIEHTTYYAHWIDPSGITLPTTNPTRSGYNFMGWATTSGATVANVTASTVPTRDVTYYAVWLIQSATLSSIEWESTTATSVQGNNPNWPRIKCRYSDSTTPYINVSTSGVTTSKSITSSTPADTYSNITASYQGKTTTNSLTYTVTARPVTLYNVTFNVTNGTIDGSNSVIKQVNSGNSVSVTVSPNSGYKMPTSVTEALVSGYTVTVNNVTYTRTINIYCEANIPVINLNPSTNQVITEPITVTSTVTNNGVSANTNWAITNEGTSGTTFSKSTSTGASVTVTPNDMSVPEANKGTVSMSTGSTGNGTRILNASFTSGQNSTKEYTTRLTASYTGAESKSINITFRKVTLALSAGTYTWTIVGTLPSGVQLTYNGSSATLINTNSSEVSILAGVIKVENINGTNAAYNTAITVPGKSEIGSYYWYVGKNESLLGKNGTSYNLNLNLLPTVNSIDEIYTNSQNVGSENNNIYVVCPTEWIGHFELRGLDDNRLLYTDKTSQITSGVTGYSILRGTAASTVSIIKITLQ